MQSIQDFLDENIHTEARQQAEAGVGQSAAEIAAMLSQTYSIPVGDAIEHSAPAQKMTLEEMSQILQENGFTCRYGNIFVKVIEGGVSTLSVSYNKGEATIRKIGFSEKGASPELQGIICPSTTDLNHVVTVALTY